MHRPSPRRLARAVTRAAVVPLVAGWALASSVPATAQSLAQHEFSTPFDRLPDADGLWSRIGTSGVLVTDQGELLVNDNSSGDCIAFQSLLGEIEAGHRVMVSARMRVLTNFGGETSLIEISRPGLELLVRFTPDRVEVLERRGGREPYWLAGAAVDLTEDRKLRVTKLAVTEDPLESLVIEIQDVEVLRVAGRGNGQLGVGRIVFGSLDYPSYGASVWTRFDVSVVPIEPQGSVRTEHQNLGALKASYRR